MRRYDDTDPLGRIAPPDEADLEAAATAPENDRVITLLPVSDTLRDEEDRPYCLQYLEPDQTIESSTPLTQTDVSQIFRSIFYGSRLNQLRAIDRQQALIADPSGDPIPLEEYERVYHLAQVVELILERGAIEARKYCLERDFTPEDQQSLMTEAQAFIIAASSEHAKMARELAVSRYNKLFERLYFLRDYKGAALVQRCLDKICGLESDNSDEAAQTLHGLMEVMQRVARETPNPLVNGKPTGLIGTSKGEKSVEEVVPGSSIREEHSVE